MDEPFLSLKWNNHNFIFSDVMHQLRTQEIYTDAFLACENRVYPVHRFVLSICSEYFRSIFDKLPCIHPVIFLRDVPKKDVEYIIDFMYKGDVQVIREELVSLLKSADALKIKGLAVPDGMNSKPGKPPDPPKSNPTRQSPKTAKRKLLESTNSVEKKVSPKSNTASSQLNASPSQPEQKKIKIESTEYCTKSNTTDHPTNIESTNTETPLVHNTNPDAAIEEDSRDSLKLEIDEYSSSSRDEDSDSSTELSSTSEDENEDDNANNNTNAKDDKGNQIEQVVTENIQKENDDLKDNESKMVPVEPETNGATEDNDSIPLAESEIKIESFDEEISENNNSLDHLPMDLSSSSLTSFGLSAAELLQISLNEETNQFKLNLSMNNDVNNENEEAGDNAKKPFTCALCGHCFTRRDNLANHIKTHTGDRPYECTYCHKSFSRKDYLRQHERIHTGVKPYVCTICGRGFTRKEGLTDHMRCHSDVKEFVCNICGKEFKQKCGLRFHKRNYKH